MASFDCHSPSRDKMTKSRRDLSDLAYLIGLCLYESSRVCAKTCSSNSVGRSKDDEAISSFDIGARTRRIRYLRSSDILRLGLVSPDQAVWVSVGGQCASYLATEQAVDIRLRSVALVLLSSSRLQAQISLTSLPRKNLDLRQPSDRHIPLCSSS